MNVHYGAGTVLGFWGASVNKIDKIFVYDVHILEREPNEQIDHNDRWDNDSEEEKLSNIKRIGSNQWWSGKAS